MRFCVPDFFEKFHCIADRCTDTCCVGWEIDVDEDTEAMYMKVPGDFGKKLKANIFEGHFKLTPEERCPFLDCNNLCEIIKNIGENSLCDICREHPRFVEYFGDYKEQGLGLCCEEAVRLLLESKEPLSFNYGDCDDYPDELDEEEFYRRDEILGHRHNIFTILTQREYPLDERIARMLTYAEAVDTARRNAFLGIDEEYEDDEYTAENVIASEAKQSSIFDINSPELLKKLVEFLEKSESYGKEWDIALAQIKARDENLETKDERRKTKENVFSDEEMERIVCYMIFRYYAKSFFDGQGLIKAKFAAAFYMLIKNFANELAGIAQGEIHTLTTKINAIKLLSKQLEYSEGNMAMFEIMFMQKD